MKERFLPRLTFLYIGMALIFSNLAACANISSTQGEQLAQSIPVSVSHLKTPLTAIRMFSAKQGWALTTDSVLKTTDGGQTWVNVNPPYFSLATFKGTFVNQNTVWILGITQQQQFVVQHTSDGGNHWQSAQFSDGAIDTGGVIDAPQFINQEDGWLDVQRAYSMGTGIMTNDIFATTDGGSHWSRLATYEQIHQNASASDVDTGITIKDKQDIWETVTPVASPATGEIANVPLAYVTHDGGQTWQQQTLPPIAALANATYMTTPPTFFGDYGLMPVNVTSTDSGTSVFSVYTTHDGGSNWSNGPATTFDAQAVYIADQQNIWVASLDGTMHKSQDSGQSWQTLGSIGAVAAAMSFSDMNNGWIVTQANAQGGSSVLLHTADGGRTWKRV